MTAYVEDALEKTATGAQVAFATVRKGDGPEGESRGAPASARWPTGSGHRGRPISAMAFPTWWTSASPGWPRTAQRSAVNTEAKVLMLGHAFEVWKVHRVGLQTDVRNARSRAAIERIGGRLDGIMRADRPGADDTVRTSARFSILAAEWPSVKERLTDRLQAGSEPAAG
jgi:hypothetical protein